MYRTNVYAVDPASVAQHYLVAIALFTLVALVCLGLVRGSGGASGGRLSPPRLVSRRLSWRRSAVPFLVLIGHLLNSFLTS